ncbi:MAG: hemolysin III family protein [Actinomycetota bacterium]
MSPPSSVTLPETKPRLRGRLHQIAFYLSIPQGVAAVAAAAGAASRVAAGVYATSLAGLFGASSLYHRMKWSPRALGRMRRLDHAMIFVLIAGTYTPFALLVLHGAWSIAFLALAWAGAVAGITIKILSIDRLATLGGAMYIILGWLIIIALPQIIHGLSPVALMLFFAGGVLYTSGAAVLWRRWPNPSPKWFGYHEVWHSMVIVASMCHYAAIMLLLTSE